MSLRDEHAGAHVGGRNVVLRVVGPLPHIQRPRGVEYHLPGKERPDTARNRLDMVDLGDHRGITVHVAAPPVLIKLATDIPARGPARWLPLRETLCAGSAVEHITRSPGSSSDSGSGG